MRILIYIERFVIVAGIIPAMVYLLVQSVKAL